MDISEDVTQYRCDKMLYFPPLISLCKILQFLVVLSCHLLLKGFSKVKILFGFD